MSNELIFFIELIVAYGILLLINKFFGKEGLIAWVAIASILANVLTAKNVDAFGMTYTLGTIMFASTFLATDILSERFGKESAKKGVYIGLLGTLCLVVFSQIGLWYKPSVIDYAHDSMNTLFSLSLRISISSMVMYFIANMMDVYIYNKLKEKTGDRLMWVRNNVATILCNCLENFFFMFGAFYKVFDTKDVLMMAISTSLVEIIAGILDTPFLYLATRKERKERAKVAENVQR